MRHVTSYAPSEARPYRSAYSARTNWRYHSSSDPNSSRSVYPLSSLSQTIWPYGSRYCSLDCRRHRRYTAQPWSLRYPRILSYHRIDPGSSTPLCRRWTPAPRVDWKPTGIAALGFKVLRIVRATEKLYVRSVANRPRLRFPGDELQDHASRVASVVVGSVVVYRRRFTIDVQPSSNTDVFAR